MADNIPRDEQWRMELRANAEHYHDRMNRLFERSLARMGDIISGSSDSEAEAIKATNQRKRPRLEELKELQTEVSKLRAEIQRMEMEGEEMKSKLQLKENENKELRRALKEMEENQKQMGQIPTKWQIRGQNFSSLEDCQDWILLQKYDQQDCQGSDYNITASDAGPSFVADFNFTSEFDDLVANLNFTSEFDDLVAGIPNDPGAGAGSSSGAMNDEPVVDADDIDQFICDPDDGNRASSAFLILDLYSEKSTF